MALSIYSNIASLNSQRSLVKNQDALAQSLQRLSSGLRINSAKDDAAGLAISERFTAQVRGVGQAMRNASDAISLSQTAESGLTETGNILQRLRELAVQAANDTNTASDRAAIMTEVHDLQSEIDRIATTSNFNGRNLLDGSFTGMTFQVGSNQGQTISVNLSSSRVTSIGAVAQATGTAVTATTFAAGDVIFNGISVGVSSAADDTKSTVGNSFSSISKAAAMNAVSAASGVYASVNANTVTGGAIVGGGALAAGNLTINGSQIITATAVQAGDANSVLRNAINALSSTTGVTATVTAGALTLTATDGRNIDVVANAGGIAIHGAAQATTYGTITLTSDSDFSITGAALAKAGLGAVVSPVTVNTAVNVNTIDLTTATNAGTAMNTLDYAIRQVSTKRATLGAVMNRVQSTLSNLGATSENLQASRSRIQDADFAAETASFARNQILMNAAVTMLAQANVSGQIALTLLGAK